jgi:hypothetical protein
MKLNDDICNSLLDTFQKYACYFARVWGADADEIEAQMWLALVEHGETSTNPAGQPLLVQKPAYIARRMIGWAGGRMRAQMRRDRVRVSLVEEMQSRDASDVLLAVDLERFYESLSETDQQILALLADGRSVRSLERDGWSRRRVNGVRRALAALVA